jgi:outer membrane protein
VRAGAPHRWLGLGALFLAWVCAEAAAQTIDDAMVGAYQTNPQLLSARAQLRALDEGVPAALSGWRPTVTVGGQIGKAWDTNRFRTDAGNTFKEDIVRTPDSANVIITQPLYRGGQTLASVSQAENNVQAGRAALHSTEQQVLLQAATAFANLQQQYATLEVTISNIRVLTARLDESRAQFRVGEVTVTDVSQSEARLQQAVANRIQAEGNLASARATYEQVVGLPAPARPVPGHGPPNLPASQSEAEAGIVANPDIIAARFNEKAAADAVDVVLGQKLPLVNLNGIVQRNTETGGGFGRGVQQDNATVALSVTLPLYQAGLTDAQARSAKQTAGQRRIDIETATRQTVQGAVQNWSLYEAARSQVQAFEAQVRAYQVAFNSIEQEQRVGTRTVVDVLNAQQDLFNAQVNLVSAQRDVIVYGYQLSTSVGRLTASELSLPVELYDPVSYYRNARGKWFGTSIDDGDGRVSLTDKRSEGGAK